MEIETAEITFGPFGNNDYRRLAGQRADANNGQAFLTEFAGPTSSLQVEHPYLSERKDRYLTRHFSIITPEEMTLDPVFGFEDRPDVSNVRDASQLVGLYRRRAGHPLPRCRGRRFGLALGCGAFVMGRSRSGRATT